MFLLTISVGRFWSFQSVLEFSVIKKNLRIMSDPFSTIDLGLGIFERAENLPRFLCGAGASSLVKMA